MIIDNLPVFPMFILVNVRDPAFELEGSFQDPCPTNQNGFLDLSDGDWVKLIILSRSGNENSYVRGQIWVSVQECVPECDAFFGRIEVHDPAIPATQKMENIIFYGQNIYEIKVPGQEIQTEFLFQ